MGWCIACSSTDRQRIIATVLFLGFDLITFRSGSGILEWYMVLAGLVLLWFDEIPAQIPRVFVTVINAAAAASLFIYLTHDGFKFLLRYFPPLLSVACAMVCGFVVWKLWEYGLRVTRGWFGKPMPSSAPSDSW
jgi:hypothetical protein